MFFLWKIFSAETHPRFTNNKSRVSVDLRGVVMFIFQRENELPDKLMTWKGTALIISLLASPSLISLGIV